MDAIRSLVIIGAGGHGRVVAEIAADAGFHLTGFLDQNLATGTKVNGLPVCGQDIDDIFARKFPPDQFSLFIAIGDNTTRMRLVGAARAFGYACPVLIHPSAVISRTASIAAGTVIMPQVVVNANSRIGMGCIVNTSSSLDHDNHLDDGVQICPGVTSAGTVRYHQEAFVGSGATVIPGMTIGRQAMIAAGSVVVKDVPDNARVAGVPARPMT